MDQRPNRVYVMWVLAGGYLLYLACQLLSDQKSESVGMKGYIFVVLFAVAGAVLVVRGAYALIKKEGLYLPRQNEGDKAEVAEEEDVTEAADCAEEEDDTEAADCAEETDSK